MNLNLVPVQILSPEKALKNATTVDFESQISIINSKNSQINQEKETLLLYKIKSYIACNYFKEI